jgi:GntR family transcriptional regulator
VPALFRDPRHRSCPDPDRKSDSRPQVSVAADRAGEFGIKQVGYRDQIKVRAPDEVETAFFKLPADGRVGVFSVLRTTFDQEAKPVRLTISVYPADRNQFAVNVGDVPAVRPVAS